MTFRNWLIGYYIVEFEQNGEDRAAHGSRLREKIADKIINPGHPTEVYFKDDPAFSKKFNVIAANKSQAQRSMTKAFRNVIIETGKTNWEIEIVNSSMVIGGVHPLDPKQTAYLAEIAGKFSRVK